LELALLLIATASAAAGLPLRRVVSRTAGRILIALGVAMLALGAGAVELAVATKGQVLGVWTSWYYLALGLLGATLLVPFGLTVSWGRPRRDRSVTSES
jgi:hypothetical protein